MRNRILATAALTLLVTVVIAPERAQGGQERQPNTPRDKPRAQASRGLLASCDHIDDPWDLYVDRDHCNCEVLNQSFTLGQAPANTSVRIGLYFHEAWGDANAQVLVGIASFPQGRFLANPLCVAQRPLDGLSGWEYFSCDCFLQPGTTYYLFVTIVNAPGRIHLGSRQGISDPSEDCPGYITLYSEAWESGGDCHAFMSDSLDDDLAYHVYGKDIDRERPELRSVFEFGAVQGRR